MYCARLPAKSCKSFNYARYTPIASSPALCANMQTYIYIYVSITPAIWNPTTVAWPGQRKRWTTGHNQSKPRTPVWEMRRTRLQWEFKEIRDLTWKSQQRECNPNKGQCDLKFWYKHATTYLFTETVKIAQDVYLL